MSSIFELFAGLWHFAEAFVMSLADDARSYGVNPRVFVALYLITWPLWYYTMWWVVSGWHRKDRTRMRRGVWSNRLATVTPYAYVLLVGGTGMSWHWYAFTVVLPIVTTSLFLHKVKNDEWMEKWWETYQKVISRFRFNKKSTAPKEV